MIRSSVKGLIWLTVAVTAGFVGGVAFERQWVPSTTGSPMDPVNVMRALDKSLALDSAQHAAIVGILSRRQAAIDSAWIALQPGMRAAVDSSQIEIARVLRADQAAKFLELMRAKHPPTRGTMGKGEMPR